MGSMVPGVMEALVGRLSGRAREGDRPGLARPGGESRDHPLGGRNDPMVAVGACVRKMLLQ
jgi:hypothetical protein